MHNEKKIGDCIMPNAGANGEIKLRQWCEAKLDSKKNFK